MIGFRRILCLLGMVCAFGATAQNRLLDSIRGVIKTASHDTTLAAAYVALTEAFASNSTDSLIPYCNKALEVVERNLAAAGPAEKASYLRTKALAINNIGYVYYFKGNYAKGLEYYLQALTIREQVQDIYGISESLYNIATVYRSQGNVPKAIEYMEKSVRMSEEKNDKASMALAYYGIGTIYLKQGDHPKAMEYYMKSLKLNQELGITLQVCRNYNSIGNVFLRMGREDEAMKYYRLGLDVASAISDMSTVSSANTNLGNIYFARRDYAKALTHGQLGLAISQQIGNPDRIRVAAKLLSDVYSAQKQPGPAFGMYKLYIQMRDSISNQEAEKAAIEKRFQYEYEKKAAADSVRIAEEKKVSEAQHVKERTQRYALYGGLLLMLVFALFMLNRFKVTHKQKLLIENQKALVEEKQKEMLDSITYAKKIQQAVLKEEEHVSKHLPSHFIFFRPKDIVSGDFYWALEKRKHLYMAAADCTGHGVPGAFLTMLGVSFLNEINAGEQLLRPDEVLNELRNKVVAELGATGQTKDGMDISFFRLNLENRELMWAGAYNPLWYVREGKLVEVKGDKQPIGYSDGKTLFTNHLLQLQKGDVIYIFTDGYADQFGGAGGKKFKYKQLEQMILDMHLLPMDKQKEIVTSRFEAWKGDHSQVDDVCFIGMTV
jgi:serine phosphatase RsbU (regulator of sigma subunit)/TPR repeat protein